MADYDVIVIGSGIGGLTSASLLQKRGLRVLLLEQNPTAGGLCNTISKNGYRFDTGTSLFWGFGDGEVFHWLFHEFNIQNILSETESLIRRIEPGLQIILPNHRVNVYSEREKFYDEIKREFPSDLANLMKFYQESDRIEGDIFNILGNRHPYSFKNHYQKNNEGLKRLYTLLSILFKKNRNIFQLYNRGSRTDSASEIERFIDLQLIFFLHKRIIQTSLPLSSVILGIPQRGIYGIKGGAAALAHILEREFIKYGGKGVYDSTVEEIIIKKRRACGVRVRTKNSVSDIGGKWIIADTPVSNIGENLIKKKKRGLQFSKIDKKMGAALVPFSVLLGVDEKVIPEPMGEHAIMLRDYEYLPEGDNVIFVSVSPSWDKSRAPDGKRSITATYFIPEDKSSKINWEMEKDKKKEEMILFLEQLMPFISDFVDCAYTLTPEDYQHISLRNNGIIRPFNNYSNIYGFNGLPFNTPLKKLLIVGDNAFPGPGIAHTAKSGIRAAEYILKKY